MGVNFYWGQISKNKEFMKYVLHIKNILSKDLNYNFIEFNDFDFEYFLCFKTVNLDYSSQFLLTPPPHPFCKISVCALACKK